MNIIAAVIAFEMAHNLALKWARAQTGRAIKNSYYLGISAGLMKIARAQKREEENRAYKTER